MDKPIFDGLLHTGKPDLEALYRVGSIKMVTRTNVVGAETAWPDPLGMPTTAWLDALAATVQAPRNIVLIDHETWPYATQADRQATAAKYVTLYQEIKARKPGWRIGWYGDPIRRDFWNSIKDRGTNEYKTWQGMNTDLGAVMAPYTDVFMPSLYFFYTRDTASSTCDYVGQYIHENIREAKRIRRMYGKLESPIYPYIWYRKHDDSRDLDADVWETIVRTVLEEADGLVLWGGWKVTAPTGPLPWDENAPWWVTIKARLMDKRRTG
jgi:hypothetical protein